MYFLGSAVMSYFACHLAEDDDDEAESVRVFTTIYHIPQSRSHRSSVHFEF
jgi:hypothetical protein